MADGDRAPRRSPGLRASVPARRAVVDIGSNSVRLVIYDGPARSPFAICNEKALCGLGRLAPDGGLDPAAAAAALAALRRFRILIDAHGAAPALAVATAAVREAADGPAFVERVRAAGFDVDVIEGDREARLAALGVVAVEPAASGLVGDMGGGSLELVRVEAGAPQRTASLSIGPLRLLDRVGSDRGALEAAAREALAEVDWLDEAAGETLFAVGGAWRAVARIHMRLRDYPLPVLHRYEMSSRETVDLCDFIARQSPASLADLPGLPKRRIAAIPAAALALKATVEAATPARVAVSAGGLREGLLFERLDATERARDPLLEGAAFLAERFSPDPSVGAAAMAAIGDLFPGETLIGGRRFAAAAATLMDVGAYFHPDLRGRQAFETGVRAQIAGVGHGERIGLALALFVRHEGASASPPEPRLVALLDSDERARATAVGLALRFLAALAPKAPAAWRGLRLSAREGALVCAAPQALAPLWTSTVARRFDALAAALGLVAVPPFAAAEDAD